MLLDGRFIAQLFFNFIDGMNGGSVVFTPQLMSDLREAKVQLGAQHVHGYLAGDNNIFIALGAQYLFDGDVEVFGGSFNDLAGA